MESWYSEKLPKGTRVALSDSGYTNKDIALIYLDHLIEHINAGPDKPSKVLLMDRHGSYMDPDFIIKATTSNIHPYPFLGHLTHVLQPLDVGVFQPYKHWHTKAIQHAMRNLDLDYNIASFMRDLHEIREETFKKSTIHSAFEKAGMWLISCKTAIAKMKVYSLPEPLIELLILPRTPTRFQHAEEGLRHWKPKLSEKLRALLEHPFAPGLVVLREFLLMESLLSFNIKYLIPKCETSKKPSTQTEMSSKRMEF